MKCSSCGQQMALEEKNTMSGRDLRTYRCRQCGRSEDVDYGVALWQIMAEAREEEKAEEARASKRWKPLVLAGRLLWKLRIRPR